MIRRRFSNRFRTQWIKIKFYTEKPDLNDTKRVENVRFCEATKQALLHPMILDRESINCPGARYAFGWQGQKEMLAHCQEKTKLPEERLISMVSQLPRFKKPFEYIGINMKGEPDLILSSIMPKDAMNLINLYHLKTGEKLDVSLCSMMSICGGIAVKTFLENRITFSFGCMDSRTYAHIGKERLVVGVPRDQFDLISSNTGK
jgi:uncharacterized protein (DUF169 family)